MPPRKLDAEGLRNPTLTIDRLGRRWVGLPAEQRLFARLLNTDSPDECWIWTGHTNQHGYGVIGIPDRRTALAHRVAYVIHHGSDPSPLNICHRCDNPPCCNPLHLFAGTQVDNMQDMSMKGRSGARKISDEKVRAIRASVASGATYAETAECFGVSSTYVRRLALSLVRAFDGGVAVRPLPPPEPSQNELAARTHCKSDHEYTPENTYIRVDLSRGTKHARVCRKCAAMYARRVREKKADGGRVPYIGTAAQ